MCHGVRGLRYLLVGQNIRVRVNLDVANQDVHDNVIWYLIIRVIGVVSFSMDLLCRSSA